MKTLLWLPMAMTALLLSPLPAVAFSFLPGGFAPGEEIQSIQLSAGAGGPTVTFDRTTNTLTFDASVSTITTNLTTYSIPLGDVLFNSQVMIVSGTETVLPPNPPFFAGQISAQFVNGIVSDLSLTDVGAMGSGLLVSANYVGSLQFVANGPGGAGLPVSGSASGDFAVNGGDGNFIGAFGSQGAYFSNLSNFTSNGVPVGSDLCALIHAPSGCFLGAPGMEIDNFTVNPTATIVPVAAPEPSVGALVLGGALALGAASRRRRTR